MDSEIPSLAKCHDVFAEIDCYGISSAAVRCHVTAGQRCSLSDSREAQHAIGIIVKT